MLKNYSGEHFRENFRNFRLLSQADLLVNFLVNAKTKISFQLSSGRKTEWKFMNVLRPGIFRNELNIQMKMKMRGWTRKKANYIHNKKKG